MSDIENDDYSVLLDGSDSDGEEIENYKKPLNFVKNKKTNARPTISSYEDDDDDADDNGENDVNEDENKNDEDIEVGEHDDDDDEYADDNEVQDEDEADVDEEDDEEDDDEDEEDEDEDEDNNAYANNDKVNNSNFKTKTGGAKKVKNKLNQDKKQNIIYPDVENNDDNYYDDNDDEQDDNYLQKFDKEITKNYIMNFHQECLNHNYDEIKALSKVTRDEFNIIIDPLHKTIPFLTKYEKTRILGQRSKQIECGAKPLVKVPENVIDSYLIAELELEQKAIPFIIRRPIPSGGSEYWNLKDLEMISF
jgi:DNA-directed RNA polymerase subunit K/omega